MKKTYMTFEAPAPKSRRPSTREAAAIMKKAAAGILLAELAEKTKALERRLAKARAEQARLEKELASARACAELVEANF